jgi:hypothetical protein
MSERKKTTPQDQTSPPPSSVHFTVVNPEGLLRSEVAAALLRLFLEDSDAIAAQTQTAA